MSKSTAETEYRPSGASRPLDHLCHAVRGDDDQLRGPPGPVDPEAGACRERAPPAAALTRLADSEASIRLTDVQYGNILAAFQIAYALGVVFAGRLVDRVGCRTGYPIVTGLWSLAAMGHALVQSVLGFAIARFLLGLGESGNFPAAVKATAEWFPPRERALATGIFNSGASVGGHPGASRGAVGSIALRVARVVSGYRVLQRDVDCVVVDSLSNATAEEPAKDRRAAPAPSSAGRMVDTAALSPGVGLHARQVSYRSGVVVLPFLAPAVLQFALQA